MATASISTGLKTHLLGSSSVAGSGDFQTVMADSRIHVYAFSASTDIPGPDDAVDTVSAYTLLATILSDGGIGGAVDQELTFADAENGVIRKPVDHVWDSSNGTTVGGEAAFFAHVVASGDDDGDSIAASTDNPRIIGSVGEIGSILNLSDATIQAGVPVAITNYVVTIG